MSENTDYETLAAEYIELDKKYRAVAAENMLLKVAARDMLGGWKEIRRSGGENEIYGIGWDRSQSAVESALYTPATTQALKETKVKGRVEAANFIANHLLAAFESGFVDKSAKEVADVARMILGSIEFMPNALPEDFTSEYSEQVLGRIVASLRGNN
ncbi:TPA: ead/Ea22-like family protein [Yersinia enterocolitica]